MTYGTPVPEEPASDAELITLSAESIRQRLPDGWSFTATTTPDDPGPDTLCLLRDPEGRQAVILVEARRLLPSRDVPALAERLSPRIQEHNADGGLIVSRYLAPPVRERLMKAGLSYVDATGNIHVRMSTPAVFIADRGADRDPWRGPGRPRGTLKGEPAATVVRTLLDFEGPWRIRQLIDTSGASTGSVYRVLDFLESESLVTRDEDGVIEVPSRTKILRRWSIDYQFLRTNTVTRWIAPRGLESFLQQVRIKDYEDYAVTGSVAAATWAEYAPTRSAMLYCADPKSAADRWGLRATDTGVNVLIAQPAYSALVARAITRDDGLRVAAPTQVAIDLLTGPGRAPAEAEALIEWMQAHDQL